jgi:hypothetical protein
MRCWALLSKEEEKLRLIEGNKSSEVAAMDVVSNVGWNIFNCVFGWGAAGAERSRPAPTAIWMGERLQGDYTPRCGSLHPSKFEGWSCSASVSLYRLSSVSLPSLSLSLSCLRQGRAGGVGMGGGDPRHAMVAQGGSKELPRRPLLHICITTADEARDRGGGTRGRATAGARPATVDLANR